MEKERIEALVVVEGKSDTERLRRYYDVDTFETSGMGLNEAMLTSLEALAQKRQIIILTDPDMPGEYIRNKISERISNCAHVILPKTAARSKGDKKLGIEYAKKADLDLAFAQVHMQKQTVDVTEQFTQADMLEYGFVGLTDSRKRRDYIADTLHLGRINAKQFLKRLNMFTINRSELETLLDTYQKESEK